VNYLAHAYLSFGEPQIETGNLISDFVKGKKKYDYPPRILAGINLHRLIDDFTDSHPINKKTAVIFKPAYGLYASAFLDVVYDHFLARELSQNAEAPFEAFTHEVYAHIERFTDILPSVFNNIFPYMKQHNWLFNYQYAWGVERSLAGLTHRAAYISDSGPAFELFQTHYDDFREAYETFFPRLRTFSLEKFSDIH
jgi:acyl carrier protein phosphodiesterase